MFEENDNPAFAGQLQFGGIRSSDPVDRIPQTQAITTRVLPSSDLDGERAESLFKKLLGHYRRELYRQADNRREMEKDADFYDGDQYSADDKAILEKRGQMALVYNVIATTINWLLGTEKRSRVDYKVLPRREEGSKPAERKSQIMKYLTDVNNAEFAISDGFADQVKVGVGWLECGLQGEEDGQEPIYERRESWRNMVFDSAATDRSLDNGRYIFRTKWADTDIAYAKFPSRRSVIARAANQTHEFARSLEGYGDSAMDHAEEEMTDASWDMDGKQNDSRDRVRLIEAWFRVPVADKYVRGGDFAGDIFDPMSPGHLTEVETGRATVVSRVKMRVFVAIMTEAGLLYMSKSPYRHNMFPFTPIWCYRRDRDNLPYSVIRQLRGPQTDINKRASKALHILSSNKIIMEEGAVADVEILAEEAASPDGIIVTRPNKRLEMNVDRDLSSAHLDLMERSIQMIQQVGGVTDENLGRTTNAVSGKAITARQDQGGLATFTIFDNLRYARQVHGSKKLSLVEQFMSEEKKFRITDMRGNPQFITANDGLPENDIVRTKADFIISEDDFNATIRQAQVNQLLELMSQLAPTAPQIVLVTLDLLVETMDVPQREELVKRIRQQTGAEDPDADPNNPDEETLMRREAAAREQEKQERMAEAEIRDKEASVAEKEARARKIAIETDKIFEEVARIMAETKNAGIEIQVRAMEAAAQLVANQGLAGVADAIIAEAEPPRPQPAPPVAPPEGTIHE